MCANRCRAFRAIFQLPLPAGPPVRRSTLSDLGAAKHCSSVKRKQERIRRKLKCFDTIEWPLATGGGQPWPALHLSLPLGRSWFRRSRYIRPGICGRPVCGVVAFQTAGPQTSVANVSQQTCGIPRARPSAVKPSRNACLK